MKPVVGLRLLLFNLTMCSPRAAKLVGEGGQVPRYQGGLVDIQLPLHIIIIIIITTKTTSAAATTMIIIVVIIMI